MSIHFFLTNLEDEILVKGGRICNTRTIRKNKRRNLVSVIYVYVSLFIITCD
jgi:uncharacterized protein Veg